MNRKRTSTAVCTCLTSSHLAGNGPCIHVVVCVDGQKSFCTGGVSE